jgi:Transposase DDE domain
LRSAEVIARFRVSKRDWTRRRQLTFAKVATLVLEGHRLPLQNNLNRFYKAMGEVQQVPTASAYCQARRKLKPELFVYLNDRTLERFYTVGPGEPSLRSWKGRRLLGVDGSYLNLPDTAETRRHYSVQKTPAGERVQALACLLYDLQNQVGLTAHLGPKRAEKYFLFEQVASATRPGDVLVMDRLFADYAVMAFCLGRGRDFVLRLPRKSFAVVNRFRRGRQQDQVVELQMPPAQQRWVRQYGLAETIRVRLVKVVLDSGEVELLATSLLDAQQVPGPELKAVYGWRWGVETYWDRLKNLLEVERFSGNRVLAIEQDFYGMVFLATLESVLSQPDQAALEQASPAQAHLQQVNHSVGYAALLDSVVELLMDPAQNAEQTLAALHHLFQTNPTLQRPGRNYPRSKLRASQKLWYCRYTKRVVG